MKYKTIITNYPDYCIICGRPAEEEWKDVVGYEGLYEVSSLGRVKSCDRTVNRKGQAPRKYNSQMISQIDHGNGYLYVSLSKADKKKNHYVHRLVAEAFIDNPDNKRCVNHKDCNRKNNSVDNLEWVTNKENNEWSKNKGRYNIPHYDSRTNKEFGKSIRIKKGKFEVTVVRKYIGRFSTLEEAQKARDEYVKEYYHEV